jgi:hypothetical protein
MEGSVIRGSETLEYKQGESDAGSLSASAQ